MSVERQWAYRCEGCSLEACQPQEEVPIGWATLDGGEFSAHNAWHLCSACFEDTMGWLLERREKMKMDRGEP